MLEKSPRFPHHTNNPPYLRLVGDGDGEQPDRTRAPRALVAGRLMIRSDRHGTAHVITVSGELDVATAGALADELEEVLSSDAQLIDLDLSGLTFIALRGVRVVDAATAQGGERLEVRRLPRQVQRVQGLAGALSAARTAA
jgi:anti-anti-sigma factor